MRSHFKMFQLQLNNYTAGGKNLFENSSCTNFFAIGFHGQNWENKHRRKNDHEMNHLKFFVEQFQTLIFEKKQNIVQIL